MPAGANPDALGAAAARPRATLLGTFSLSLGQQRAGPWQRPSARRLVELVLINPGRRIRRETAAEVLFSQLAATEASGALRKALSLARTALSALGDECQDLLSADRDRIWASPDIEVDSEAHQTSLRAALARPPGRQRDEALSIALGEEGTLLEDEPLADWALRPREALEALRQEARLCLARDRAQGLGCSALNDVVQAWEACFSHDATCEEAASALVRAYAVQGRHSSAAATYQRCRTALQELGLRASPSLEEIFAAWRPKAPSAVGATVDHQNDELRLVSVLFVEVIGPGTGRRLGPEDLRELVGGALAEAIAHVEALGGTVTSVSGSGLVALFGAPESHEDDPERALRASFRIVNGHDSANGSLSFRAGVETGRAVVGAIAGGSSTHYGAVGEVVGSATALQRVARPGSVLVGPVTRGAVEGLFEWGPSEKVTVPGAGPVSACYLSRPRARPLGPAGRRRFAAGGPLVGRQAELSLLRTALREATSGQGSLVTIVGEAGLGKSRLVNECRRLFMVWAGNESGRLPLWLEGRAASYASSVPYGLYQQLLAGWLGVAPEEGEEVVSQALERALKVLSLGGAGNEDHLGHLTHVMGLKARREAARLADLSPEARQRASFSSVRAVVSELVARGPTVLVLEDLHWADATSLKLTQELCPLSAEGPLLVVMTRRPEPDPGVSDLESSQPASIVTRKVALSPLRTEAEHELAEALIGEKASDAVLGAVIQNTGGNPLFLEERIFSLLETGVLARDDAGWYLGEGSHSGDPGSARAHGAIAC